MTKTHGPAFGIAELGEVHAVLLSHDQHADNLDPAGRYVVARAPLTLTTASAAARLGGTTRALATWDTVVMDRPGGGALEITAAPARHGPEGCEPITGEVTGFVLAGRGLPTVYVSGDNASLDVVQEIKARVGTVDVALLFAGAARTSLLDGRPLTLTSAAATAAAHLLAARWIIPLHTRGWAHFSEGPDQVRAAFENARLTDRLRIVDPGQTVTSRRGRTSQPTTTRIEDGHAQSPPAQL